MQFEAHYFLSSIFVGAMWLYILYRGVRHTARIWLRREKWKSIGLGVLLAVLVGSYIASPYLDVLFRQVSLLQAVAAKVASAGLGVVLIYLERRYYPDA